MELQKALESRYSARGFDPAQVPTSEQIEKVLDAGRLAATACNYQSQRIWVVSKPEDLRKIDKTTSYRYNAPVVFIFGYDDEVAAKHNRWGGEEWSFGRDDMDSALVQMMLKATDIGLATCWVGGFDDVLLRELFDFPNTVKIRAMLDLGTPTQKGVPGPMHTSRLPLEETVTWL